MKLITLIFLGIIIIPLLTISQVLSDFETDIDNWYSEGDGYYEWEIGTGNPGNNFRVNDDATGNINLGYAPIQFLGNWSNATTSDYVSVDIYLHQINGGYVSTNYVFYLEGPGGKARALQVSNPPFDTWTTYSLTLDPANWEIQEGTWSGILAQVNEFIVRMEYINGDEWVRADNVYLSFTPQVVPIVPVICSGFEEGGFDGWSFSGTGSASNISSGGNPGRYLQINNSSNDGIAYVPPKFLGDWTQLDNHAAEFRVDLRILSYSGSPLLTDNFIKITGAGGEAKFALPTNISYAYDNWHTVTIPVNSSDWTMISGTWNALLPSVVSMELNLEFFDGSERVDIDNFCVTNTPPLADFTLDLPIIFEGAQVTFTDQSLNAPTTWSWDFGDTQTSTVKNPSHTYASPGIYDVTLTVSNHFGSDDITYTSAVEVIGTSSGCEFYADDFEDLTINPLWQIRNGTWSESGGLLKQTSNYYGGNDLDGCYALIGSALWQDYIISTDIFSTDNDGMGLVINYQDEQNLYMFYWRRQTNERKISKWENGVQTILASDAVPYLEDTWYNLQFQNLGGELKAKINGETVLSATDNTFTSGKVALYCWANDETHYDNFKVTCEGFEVDVKAMLEGPFEELEMSTELNTGGYIPLEQPFDAAPWMHSGLQSVENVPVGITDWVLIELRDAVDAASALPSTTVARQAAFINYQGAIVQQDGTSTLRFTHDVQNNLFVVIYHRNHIPVMSASPLNLSGNNYEYDFTTAATQAFGTNALKDMNGIFGLYAGDLNADGTINLDDKNIDWQGNAGSSGYLQTDVNLDGQADNLDKNDIWLNNQGESLQVPQ